VQNLLEMNEKLDSLYDRLESLSKALESSGRIDEHESPDAYATVLDAMNFVLQAPISGYQRQNDTWHINGVIYSGDALRWLSKAQGEVYRVTRAGEIVTMERVHNHTSEHA